MALLRRNRPDVSRLIQFLSTEEASGVLLVAAALVALLWANSPAAGAYALLAGRAQHWVNDGLMTLFFLVVGLEIKREVTTGELRDPRKLALPAVAAVGGMVVPACVYLILNAGRGDTVGGWGVPVATDIAFALGVLTLAGTRAPVSVRSFLLTLAIVDDIGAVLLIAVFYSGGLDHEWLLVALAVTVAFAGGRWFIPLYVVFAVGLWVALERSGVHPTVAGVVVGLLTPQDRIERIVSVLHPWTSRLVVPIFALTNAGVSIAGSGSLASPVGLGVFLGLVVGKPLGIGAAVWAARRTGLGRLPSDVTPGMIAGVAVLAGVGFTMSIFIAELGFDGLNLETAKIAILVASAVAGVIGACILRLTLRR
jgi:Na+:H+ antiporter, NhaA family